MYFQTYGVDSFRFDPRRDQVAGWGKRIEYKNKNYAEFYVIFCVTFCVTL